MNKKLMQLLVSTPHNGREGYYRTVILIFDDCSGTLGLCLNRLVKCKPCTCGLCEPPPAPLFLGGPVGIDEEFFFLHDQKRLAKKGERIFKNVYLSPPWAVENFTTGIGRMITGYCKWQPGELDEEIAKGWWIVEKNPDPQLILANPRNMWHYLTPRHFKFDFSEN